MNLRALLRILFPAGIGTAIVGLYIGANTSDTWNLGSYLSIAVIAIGAYITIVALVFLLTPHEDAVEEERSRLPDVSLPLVYGGFIGAISIGAGLIAGHYLGRNDGFITFIFAFILANLIFGLPLAIARSAVPR